MNSTASVTEHRTQIYLPNWLYRQVKEKASKGDVSMAQFIRKILEKAVQEKRSKNDKNKEKTWEKFFSMAGIADIKIKDLSTRHDDYLADVSYEEMMEKRSYSQISPQKKRA